MGWSDGYRDAGAAREEVKAWFRALAAKRGWSSTQLSAALALSDEAYEAADEASWTGADKVVYWETLARAVQRPEFRTFPEWPNVADTVKQALVAVGSEEQYRFDTSWYGGVIGGTAAAGAAVGAAATEAAGKVGEVADKVTNPVWIWGVALAVVGIAVIQSGGFRRMR